MKISPILSRGARPLPLTACLVIFLVAGCASVTDERLDTGPADAIATPGSMSTDADGIAESTSNVTESSQPSESSLGQPPERSGGYRLLESASPYLIQHASNPVEWWPWGEDAFEAARAQGRPIFLSIGYSSCHWCHVMREESFEDAQVAALMNANFISIKVDREVRPDIDAVYMQTCQVLGGRCGWPLNILLTPEREPFFATTYVPRLGRFGQPGMMELVPEVSTMWFTKRDEILTQARDIAAHQAKISAPMPSGEIGDAVLDLGYDDFRGRYDAQNGGFGQAPKFPSPHTLFYLTRYWERTGEAQALEMVEHTLDAMRAGGVFDQVGFGFHRYSTDDTWTLPHFEKMLYDQAMHMVAYSEAFRASGRERDAEVVREIARYVLRDLTSPEGAFYSAEDADSEGEEGRFYFWTAANLEQALGQEDAARVSDIFQTVSEGNIEDEASGIRTGDNVLRRAAPVKNEPALDGPPDLELIRRRLLDARSKRERPLRDEKILADWNGLMIAGLARASIALDDPALAEAAARAAAAVQEQLVSRDGRLMHSAFGGSVEGPATLDDLAFMTWGLIELHQATQDVAHLEQALALSRVMLDKHGDSVSGGLFLTADDAEPLLVRTREIYDGAIPSGNAVAMWNLVRLSRLSGDVSLEERAAEIGRSFARQVSSAPSGHAMSLVATDFAIGPTHEVVVVGDPDAEDTTAMLSALREGYFPRAVVVLRPVADAVSSAPIDDVASYTEYLVPIEGNATAYVCESFICDEPTTDIQTMLASLGGG